MCGKHVLSSAPKIKIPGKQGAGLRELLSRFPLTESNATRDVSGARSEIYQQAMNSRKQLIALTLTTIMITGCSTTTMLPADAELNEEIINTILAIEAFETEKLNEVTWRVLTKNEDKCQRGQRRTYGFSAQQSKSKPGIHFVKSSIKGSPAWRAGLRRGNKIKKTREKDGALIIDIDAAKGTKAIQIEPTWICDIPIGYIQSETLEAYFEHNVLFITSGLLKQTTNDSQIAAIIAHEWAHDIDGSCNNGRQTYIPVITAAGREVIKRVLTEIGLLGLTYIFERATQAKEPGYSNKGNRGETKDYRDWTKEFDRLLKKYQAEVRAQRKALEKLSKNIAELQKSEERTGHKPWEQGYSAAVM